MKNHITKSLFVVLLCCLMAACLPGKKREEKVIADAAKATQSVMTEKVAADLSSAAQALLAGSDSAANSSELKTLRCPDGRVLAYVPRSAKIAKAGELPKALASRMREQLQAQYSPANVKTASEVASCGGDPQLVALNGPVLVLDSISANLAEIKKDEAVASFEVGDCGTVIGNDGKSHKVPGVIVRYNDGRPDENKCGTASLGGESGVQLSGNTMPDWKKRLSGDTTATTNFKCVVRKDRTNGCIPVSDQELGDKMECSENAERREMVLNPVFNNASNTFVSGPGNRDCGKGWTGDLIAQVDTKVCTITRKDGSTSTPSTVYNIAYVAARCSKENVTNIPVQCPAGPGTFFARYGKVDMVDPILLEPQTGQRNRKEGTKSLIAVPDTAAPSAAVTESILAKLGGTKIFKPTTNLRPVSDPDQFSASLVADMGESAKLYQISGCNTVGNTCGASPDHVVIILDRSISMGSTDPAQLLNIKPSINTVYACKAGLRNIFKIDSAADACQKVSAFLANQPANPAAGEKKLLDFILTPWAGFSGPNGSNTENYSALENALIDKVKYKPYLQQALASGWSCSGQQTAEGGMNPFPNDMFGSCHGASSCDTCPGECVGEKIGTLSGLEATRIQTAQWNLNGIAKMKMKPGTAITVAEFLNDTPNIRTTVYCPADRRNAAGVCDEAQERKNVLNYLTGGKKKVFLKPVTQEVIIPKLPPSISAGTPAAPVCTTTPGGSPVCTTTTPTMTVPAGPWKTFKQATADGTFNTSGSYEYRACATLTAPSTGGATTQNRILAYINAAEDFFDENFQSKPATKTSSFSAVYVNNTGTAYIPANMFSGVAVHPWDRSGMQYCGERRTAPVANVPVTADIPAVPAGPWQTFQEANNTSTNIDDSLYEYDGCQSRARVLKAGAAGTHEYTAKVLASNWFQNYFGIDVVHPGSVGSKQWAPGQGYSYLYQLPKFASAQVPWDKSVKPYPALPNGGDTYQVTYCSKRRTKATPAIAGPVETCTTPSGPVTTCTTPPPTTSSCTPPTAPPVCTTTTPAPVCTTPSCSTINVRDQIGVQAYGPSVQMGANNVLNFRIVSNQTFDEPITVTFDASYRTNPYGTNSYSGTLTLNPGETTGEPSEAGYVIYDAAPDESDPYITIQTVSTETINTCPNGPPEESCTTPAPVTTCTGGGTADNCPAGTWTMATPGNGSNPQMDRASYDYSDCVFVPATSNGIGTDSGAFYNQQSAQTALIPSNYTKADLWHVLVPQTQAKTMWSGSAYRPINLSQLPNWGWADYDPAGTVDVYCTKRSTKGASASCGGVVAGKWKTANEAHADGTFQNSYLQPVKEIAPNEYRYQDTANYEFDLCHPYTPCNGNCEAAAGNNWLTAKEHGSAINYCEKRRAKDSKLDEPATCLDTNTCDPSACALLIDGEGGGAPWETFEQANHTSTTPDIDAGVFQGTDDGYEYDDCHYLKRDVDTSANDCGTNAINLAYPVLNDQFKATFNTEFDSSALFTGSNCNAGTHPGLVYMSGHITGKDGKFVPFLRGYRTSGNEYGYGRPYGDEYKYCSKRRLKAGGTSGGGGSTASTCPVGNVRDFFTVKRNIIRGVNGNPDTTGLKITSTKAFPEMVNFSIQIHYTDWDNNSATYDGEVVLPANEIYAETESMLPGVYMIDSIDIVEMFTPEQLPACDPTPGEWLTSDQAKAAGSFDNSNKANTTAYDYSAWDSSHYFAKGYLPGRDFLDTTSYEFRNCSNVSCDSYTAGECEAMFDTSAIKNNWIKSMASIVKNNHNNYKDIHVEYCTERLKKSVAPAPTTPTVPTTPATVSYEKLLACLDKCAPKVTALTDVETCTSVPNLFNGTQPETCKTAPFPSKLDYSYEGYTGPVATKTVTRFVLGKAGDPGAIEVDQNSNDPVYGADYGGNTPLFEAIDQVLNTGAVKGDMDAKKNMAFILMTDGADTGTNATVKGVCDDSDSMLSILAAANPNTSVMFLSYNDRSPNNSKCETKLGDNFVSDMFLDTVLSRVSAFASSGDYSTEAASSAFCATYFGTGDIYTSTNISSSGGGISGASICRAFETE